MVSTTVIYNSIITILLFFCIAVYSLDFTIPYPRLIFTYFQLPAVKIVVYMSLYFIAYYNPVISILALVAVLMLHLNEIFISGRDNLPKQ